MFSSKIKGVPIAGRVPCRSQAFDGECEPSSRWGVFCRSGVATDCGRCVPLGFVRKGGVEWSTPTLVQVHSLERSAWDRCRNIIALATAGLDRTRRSRRGIVPRLLRS
jgi:hypothetical protein